MTGSAHLRPNFRVKPINRTGCYANAQVKKSSGSANTHLTGVQLVPSHARRALIRQGVTGGAVCRTLCTHARGEIVSVPRRAHSDARSGSELVGSGNAPARLGSGHVFKSGNAGLALNNSGRRIRANGTPNRALLTESISCDWVYVVIEVGGTGKVARVVSLVVEVEPGYADGAGSGRPGALSAGPCAVSADSVDIRVPSAVAGVDAGADLENLGGYAGRAESRAGGAAVAEIRRGGYAGFTDASSRVGPRRHWARAGACAACCRTGGAG